jgi:hypothetical protein
MILEDKGHSGPPGIRNGARPIVGRNGFKITSDRCDPPLGAMTRGLRGIAMQDVKQLPGIAAAL